MRRPFFTGFFLFQFVLASGFQTEPLSHQGTPTETDPLVLMEAGLTSEKNVPQSIYFLAQCDYSKASASITPDDRALFPWLEPYLRGLNQTTQGFQIYESDHFILKLAPEQAFLKEYALPALEKAATTMEKAFGHRPNQKVHVEIYATQEEFSQASTLTMETLKRSGAIGICKFHRLMILSPQGLPLGYRWMDALAHEYNHLMINELSHAKAELWLHEGTAHYFDTAFRLNPPVFLTPNQKTELKKAQEGNKLIEFRRMSPSLVYLKDQQEVSLAFSQVSYSVDYLIKKFGVKSFVKFLVSLRTLPFHEAFAKMYKYTTPQFEGVISKSLEAETWPKTRGAMSDEIRLESMDEDELIGAGIRSRLRLGDRMRQMNQFEAALVEYEKALQEEPENAFALLKVARTEIALDQKEAAIKHLRHAVESNPNYGTPHIALAKLVEPKEAAELLETANALNPFDPEIHALWAQALDSIGKKAEAQREHAILEALRQRYNEDR